MVTPSATLAAPRSLSGARAAARRRVGRALHAGSGELACCDRSIAGRGLRWKDVVRQRRPSRLRGTPNSNRTPPRATSFVGYRLPLSSLAGCLPPPQLVEIFDEDGDGALEPAEFHRFCQVCARARFRSKSPRLSLACHLSSMNKHPTTQRAGTNDGRSVCLGSASASAPVPFSSVSPGGRILLLNDATIWTRR